MLKFIMRFAVLKIKNRNIVFDKNIKNSNLWNIVFCQIFSIIRGGVKLHRIVLLGRCVNVINKSDIFLGSGVSIGDFSVLDGLGEEGLHIGSSSSIGRFSIIKVSGSLTSIGKYIKIGSNVGLGDFSHIGGAGGVIIGQNTIAGAYLSIHPENHCFSELNVLIREQGVSRFGIQIGENCWIGAKVTILDGAKIGSGCVIAAGSVVTGVFPDNVVIGGVPAKIIKRR